MLIMLFYWLHPCVSFYMTFVFEITNPNQSPHWFDSLYKNFDSIIFSFSQSSTVSVCNTSVSDVIEDSHGHWKNSTILIYVSQTNKNVGIGISFCRPNVSFKFISIPFFPIMWLFLSHRTRLKNKAFYLALNHLIILGDWKWVHQYYRFLFINLTWKEILNSLLKYFILFTRNEKQMWIRR